MEWLLKISKKKKKVIKYARVGRHWLCGLSVREEKELFSFQLFVKPTIRYVSVG